MISFLQNPYVFSVVTAILTAGAVYAYQYTVDNKDREATKKLFYKVLIVGIIIGLALAYAVNRPVPVSNEPFNASDAVTTTATTQTS